VGGRGGAALRILPEERLLLGGGGGAGAGGSNGGRGGGIIFVRAKEIRGPAPRGIISANGEAAGQAADANGAGGGGAGGTVHARVSEKLSCTLLEAHGGAGGPGGGSPGGGGGGGYVFAQVQGGVEAGCTVSTKAGPGGRVGEDPRGATPQDVAAAPHAGQVTVIPVSFGPPPAPTWVTPTAGAMGVAPQVHLQGTTTPGATVVVVLDGVEQPPVVADGQGRFSLVPPTALADGQHQLSGWATYYGMRGATSKPLEFNVGTLMLAVGCGCDASASALPWLAALGVLGLVLTRSATRRGARVGRRAG
jgi:hypothetical protein